LLPFLTFQKDADNVKSLEKKSDDRKKEKLAEEFFGARTAVCD